MATKKPNKKATAPRKKAPAKKKPFLKIIKAEAWVDTMPMQSTIGGTLHVVVTLDGTVAPCFLKKKVPQRNPAMLMLDVEETNLMMLVRPPQTVTYVEHLSSSTQYTSIDLFVKGKKEKTINKIPIIK
jgi:hypothetical protein